VRPLRKPRLLLFISLVSASAGFGQVSFSGLDLSATDRLLFAATTRCPEVGAYDTLFLADARTRALRQLTFFPEDVLLLQEQDVLQIQNRFGVFRSEPGFRAIAPLAQFPSFVGGSQVQMGRIAPIRTSPDGKHLLFVRPRSAAFGDLTLLEVASGQETVLADRVEISLQELPATWSPDSRFVVYAKEASLYYFSLAQLGEERVLAEGLRRIGEGRIASARWANERSLYYISGLVVYAIDPSELFTRALYSGLLAIGKIAGKVPFSFDSNFDKFWVSPDGTSLLLDKGGRNVILVYLSPGASGEPIALPHLSMPRDTTVRKVIWSAGNVVTMLCQTRSAGRQGSAVYRMAGDVGGRYAGFTKTGGEGVRDIVLSPDESTVALLGENEVVWKDYATWEDRGRLAHPSPLHALWLNASELLVAGAFFIERVSLPEAKGTLVALSQPGEYAHAAEAAGEYAHAADATGASSGSVQVKVQGRAFTLEEPAGAWTPIAAFSPRQKSMASESYRVYLEPSMRGSYENLLFVRDAKGYGTVPLFPAESAVYEPFPAADEPVDFGNVAHGSRIRRREVALVFNAIDSSEGLTEVLNTLSAYGLRCTFFVNGEFIRRNPDAVKEIADSGHEVGSGFHAYFNMTDSRFTVDEAFVKAGLARNEDEYFAASGRELSLLWHAPYYIVTSEMLAAAAEMNYLYVGRDMDTSDWVTRTESNEARGIYLGAADLVERLVAEKRPGSIVPVQIGVGEGGRGDYLFQKLDLVVNELARLGYAIVPVSTLIEHAR
jgi:peptidoglycan/xylan/chitin deacetylase (PgdA/CDA1 family)